MNAPAALAGSKKSISSKVSISEEEWLQFAAKWHAFDFPKEATITQPGQIEPYFYFVEKGIQRLFILTKDGNEAILAFSFENSFSGAFPSFINRTPTPF